MTEYDNNNIFAKILLGDIPCDKVYENEHILAFNDIAPQAPVHILVIPKGRYHSLADFSAQASTDEIIALHKAIAAIVEEKDLSESGFRTIANTGTNGGQEVPHFHMHILAGRPLGPMLTGS